MKMALYCILLAAGITTVACAQQANNEPTPPVSPGQETPAVIKTPLVDGVVGADEYIRSFTFTPYTLGVTRIKDSLFLVVSVKTKGWVAVGLGSARMNGAVMFLGNVQNDKAGFTEQLGRGHGHGDVPADKRVTTAFAVKEENGVTTLELECKAASLVPPGKKEISIILAHAGADSFTSPHAGRKSVTVPLD